MSKFMRMTYLFVKFSTWSEMQEIRGFVTALLCRQLSRCSVLSSGSLQNRQNGVGDFLVLCRRSLVGKRFWTILKIKDFWSGDNPKSLLNL